MGFLLDGDVEHVVYGGCEDELQHHHRTTRSRGTIVHKRGRGGIFGLLAQIVNNPGPRLPQGIAFSWYMYEMVDMCFSKNPDDRPRPEYLWASDFINAARRTDVDIVVLEPCAPAGPSSPARNYLSETVSLPFLSIP